MLKSHGTLQRTEGVYMTPGAWPNSLMGPPWKHTDGVVLYSYLKQNRIQGHSEDFGSWVNAADRCQASGLLYKREGYADGKAPWRLTPPVTAGATGVFTATQCL